MRILVLVGLICLGLFAIVGCAEEGEGGSAGAGAEAERFDRELEELEDEFESESEPAPEDFEEEGSGEEEELESEPPEECDPSYEGACLDPYAVDYDCEGGSGDGPEYTGPVEVVGDDHYGLDRDGDGYACE